MGMVTERWLHQLPALRLWTDASRSVQRAVVLGIIACCYFVFFCYWKGERQFYFDAAGYWSSAKSFSLDKYTFALRGYAFPFVCLILRRFSQWFGTDEFVTFWAVSAVSMAVLGTVIVPGLVQSMLPRLKFGWWPVFVFNGLLFLFFGGHANSPLTDIPALGLLLVALWCMISGLRWSLVGGLALALAISFRPIYFLAVPGAALLIGFRLARSFNARRVRSGFVWSLLLVMGLGIGLAPQVYINHHNFARWSLLPPTDVEYKKNLYLFQLETGIVLQRYETNIGTTYPTAGIRFDDRTGKAIVIAEKNAPLNSIGDWLKLWTKYPVSLVAVYSRHLFNGLDVAYPDAYIKDPYQRSFFRSFVNYGLLYLFFSRLGSLLPLLKKNWVFLSALCSLLLPVAATIPTAIEPRFFLPIYVIMYATLAFGQTFQIGRLRSLSVTGVLYFVLFVLACHALSDTTFSCLNAPGRPL